MMQPQQAQSNPSRIEPVESLRLRILSWVYPNRKWGGDRRALDRKPAEEPVKKSAPIPGASARTSTAGTR